MNTTPSPTTDVAATAPATAYSSRLVEVDADEATGILRWHAAKALAAVVTNAAARGDAMSRLDGALALMRRQ
jgi:hypothetical protein